MNLSIADCVGIAGSLLIVAVYFANLRGTLPTAGVAYALLNLLGAALILYSLSEKWNLAAALTEVFWAGISLYGLVRAVRARSRSSGR